MERLSNLYIEKLNIIRNELNQALRLLETRPPLGILAILKRIYNRLPYNVNRRIKKLPYSLQDEYDRNIRFNEALRIFTRIIVDKLKYMIKEINHQLLTRIDVEFSMSLFPNDPAARENDDNYILNMLIPWNELWPYFMDGSTSVNENPEAALYQYILQNAIPYIEEGDFARVGAMDVNLTSYETHAWEIDVNNKKNRTLSKLETDNLLSIKSIELNVNNPIQLTKMARMTENYLKSILVKVEQLLMAHPERSGKVDELALELEDLLHDFKLIDHFNYPDSCLLGFGKWPKWENFNHSHHNAMEYLDKFMRQLEEMGVAWVKGIPKIDREEIPVGPYTLYEYQSADDNILTLWTKKEGLDYATPFWSEASDIGLFLDGEDWHEFHPYKPMCYLSHIVFVDGDINYKELEFIDYISWQMGYTLCMGISWPVRE